MQKKRKIVKYSKKKSSYASNKIEGNTLTEQQANEAIDSDLHKHFLKPEQEVQNHFLALNSLEESLKKKIFFQIHDPKSSVDRGKGSIKRENRAQRSNAAGRIICRVRFRNKNTGIYSARIYRYSGAIG
ncbi:hypothetical protein [Clostridium sp. Marseille-P3244]|uniref:hypothetical protein n=1 Tax=Clostridium sp. Marseille-P3244 TaxID=1871020 RepID=UPI000AF05D40|nr:hypothetical protein [Clostridium sp. Marseille-P3244]